MKISMEKLSGLVARAAHSSSLKSRERHMKVLNGFIQAFGMSERVNALKVQRQVFADRGLVAVDASRLAELDARMQALASSGGALADSDVKWLREGVAGLRSSSDYMDVRKNEPEPDDGSPEFTVPDHDLDTLLNHTAMLLSGDQIWTSVSRGPSRYRRS